MAGLDNTEKQSRDQYDIDLQTAQNTLDNALAGINSRRSEAQNNYNMQLGQLAENIQGRWDANANAQAALAQAKAAAKQAHRDAVNAANKQLSSAKKQALTEIINGSGTNDQKRAAIQTTFGVDASTATKVLQQLGLEPIKTFSFDTNKNYKSSTMNDLYNMLGIK